MLRLLAGAMAKAILCVFVCLTIFLSAGDRASVRMSEANIPTGLEFCGSWGEEAGSTSTSTEEKRQGGEAGGDQRSCDSGKSRPALERRGFGGAGSLPQSCTNLCNCSRSRVRRIEGFRHRSSCLWGACGTVALQVFPNSPELRWSGSRMAALIRTTPQASANCRH